MARSKTAKPRAPRKSKVPATVVLEPEVMRLVDVQVEELNADPYETVEYFVDEQGEVAARAKR